MANDNAEHPSPLSAEGLRNQFLDHLRVMVRYWATVPLDEDTIEQRLSGLLHSTLVTIDGAAGGFPCSLDLICRPHPDDKAYCIENGEAWVEDGTVINSNDMLHELLYR